MSSPTADADTEHLADLDLAPNEASGLLRVDASHILEERGWDRAFWSVLDEVDVQDCVGLIGHRAGAPLHTGWESAALTVTRHGDEGRADDAEALARHDGWIYLFGSQHGGKEGPIRRREQWVARFREADARSDASPVDLTVVRTRYLLHRLVNDALLGSGPELLPMGAATRAAFLDETRRQLAGTPDEDRVRAGDFTINVEGAELTPEGTLLLGLRYPVTAEGRPLVVALTGCAELFDGGTPQVTGISVLDAVGRGGTLAGVRDLCLLDGTLHVVTGNLDSKGKGSVLLEDHPGGRDTVNTHFAVDLGSEPVLPGRVVREFPEHPRIEGIAADGDGRFFYVSDEEEAVHLRCTPLLTEPA
jgi:hypothetical protein